MDLGADVDGAPALGDDGAVYVGTDGDEVVRLEPRRRSRRVAHATSAASCAARSSVDARRGRRSPGCTVPRRARCSSRAADGAIAGVSSRSRGRARASSACTAAPLEDDEGALLFGAQDDAVVAIDRGGQLLVALHDGRRRRRPGDAAGRRQRRRRLRRRQGLPASGQCDRGTNGSRHGRHPVRRSIPTPRTSPGRSRRPRRSGSATSASTPSSGCGAPRRPRARRRTTTARSRWRATPPSWPSGSRRTRSRRQPAPAPPRARRRTRRRAADAVDDLLRTSQTDEIDVRVSELPVESIPLESVRSEDARA